MNSEAVPEGITHLAFENPTSGRQLVFSIDGGILSWKTLPGGEIGTSVNRFDNKEQAVNFAGSLARRGGFIPEKIEEPK